MDTISKTNSDLRPCKFLALLGLGVLIDWCTSPPKLICYFCNGWRLRARHSWDVNKVLHDKILELAGCSRMKKDFPKACIPKYNASDVMLRRLQ